MQGATMPDEAVQFPPDLTPDRLATMLGGTAIPEGYASLKGYLGPMHDGVQRIFVDDTFLCWIEVRSKDIAARIDVPANEMDARSVVYLKRKAKVVTCHVSYAHQIDSTAVNLGAIADGGIPPEHPPWHHH
jgi:hypothetical protein